MFSCTPSEVLEQDEDLTYEVVRSRVARNAFWAYDTTGVDPTPAQKDTFQRMLDALDARDKRLGKPEEF